MGTLVNKQAPAFKGKAVVGKEFKDISLADYKGKWVVLYFYPLDFTFVCPTEIIAFSDAAAAFRERGTEIVGVSVDSHFTHLAWKNTPRKDGGIGDIDYPLLADTTKQVARDYGVLIEEAGIALRGLFLINPDGKIEAEIVHNLPVGRNPDEVLRILDAFQFVAKHGEVCPAGWHKGEKTMKPDPVGSKEYFKTVK